MGDWLGRGLDLQVGRVHSFANLVTQHCDLSGIATPIASTFSRYRRVSRYNPSPLVGVSQNYVRGGRGGKGGQESP